LLLVYRVLPPCHQQVSVRGQARKGYAPHAQNRHHPPAFQTSTVYLGGFLVGEGRLPVRGRVSDEVLAGIAGREYLSASEHVLLCLRLGLRHTQPMSDQGHQE